MKKNIIFIILMMLSYVGMAQKLSTPQVVGVETGSRMTVSFPFDIVGVPFSQIPGSVWKNGAFTHIMAEIYMSYYMEGDPKQYSVKKNISVNIKPGGAWRMLGLNIEPRPYHIPGKKMVKGKTYYSIFIYQRRDAQRSDSWNAEINRVDFKLRVDQIDPKSTTSNIDPNLQTDKIPDQTSGPQIVHPKDKLILNPQPIPPKADKKRIKIQNF